MVKNLFAHVWKNGFGPVGQFVSALLVCCILVCGVAAAQSTDTTGTVLRFKIPPAQPSPPPSPPTTAPAPAPGPSAATSAPVIDEKPAAPAETSSSAPTELSHEVLSPQTSDSKKPSPAQPSATEPTDASAEQQASRKSPAVQKPQPAAKTDIKGTSTENAGSVKKLLSLNVRKDDPAGEILNVMLNGFYPPRVSAAEGAPPRIICDFPEVGLEKGIPKVLPVNGKYITQVRIGLHTQPVSKVRIVLDLVPEYDYDVEQFFYQKENLYTLVVKKRS